MDPTDLLHSTHATLTTLITHLTPAQWHTQPNPESWSPAQILAHLTAVEEQTIARIESLLAQPPSPPEQLAQTEGQDALLLRHVPKRTRQRVPSPPEFAGAPTSPTPHEALARFAAARAQAIALLTRDGLHTRAFPHFAFGPLTCRQWLLMLAVHTQRHCLQIEAALNPATPD
ncbi:MAG: DinB family protein [Bryobacterales bacterium]|nr:DinB family protein [Bryobacterales bacterium]